MPKDKGNEGLEAWSLVLSLSLRGRAGRPEKDHCHDRVDKNWVLEAAKVKSRRVFWYQYYKPQWLKRKKIKMSIIEVRKGN